MLVLCRKYLSGMAAENIFILTYDRMRRYEGAWHMEKELLFPSYIFLESENEPLLADETDRIFSDVFQNETRQSHRPFSSVSEKNNGLVCMGPEEERFLKLLYGNQHHLEMSKGIIRDGIPQITAGPLQGMERRICRIDRHKRLAKLEMPMCRNRGCGRMLLDQNENHGRVRMDRDQGQDSGGEPENEAAHEKRAGYITAGLEIIEKKL